MINPISSEIKTTMDSSNKKLPFAPLLDIKLIAKIAIEGALAETIQKSNTLAMRKQKNRDFMRESRAAMRAAPEGSELANKRKTIIEHQLDYDKKKYEAMLAAPEGSELANKLKISREKRKCRQKKYKANAHATLKGSELANQLMAQDNNYLEAQTVIPPDISLDHLYQTSQPISATLSNQNLFADGILQDTLNDEIPANMHYNAQVTDLFLQSISNLFDSTLQTQIPSIYIPEEEIQLSLNNNRSINFDAVTLNPGDELTANHSANCTSHFASPSVESETAFAIQQAQLEQESIVDAAPSKEELFANHFGYCQASLEKRNEKKREYMRNYRKALLAAPEGSTLANKREANAEYHRAFMNKTNAAKRAAPEGSTLANKRKAEAEHHKAYMKKTRAAKRAAREVSQLADSSQSNSEFYSAVDNTSVSSEEINYYMNLPSNDPLFQNNAQDYDQDPANINRPGRDLSDSTPLVDFFDQL